jgi:thimet oligopeptidase
MELLSLSSGLINFTGLSVSLLESIFLSQKSLMVELNDRIASLNKENLSYSNCFEYSMEMESKRNLEFALLDFEQLHPDPEIRSKSSELNKQLSSFAIEQSMRHDVYDVISHYYTNQYIQEKEQNKLTPEQIKYIENTMIGYNMLGLGLSPDKKELVKEINKKLAAYGSDYNKNIADVNTSFELDITQLDGMEESWLTNRLGSTTDKYVVRLQYPDYIPIIEYCKVRETRKMLSEAMGSRCIDTNMPIILDTIKLRKEKAELFGFESHADFKLQNMMAKNSTTVMEFMDRLMEKIKPLVLSDKAKLLELAKELDGITDLQPYDKSYYGRIYTERVSRLNMSDLKKMFSIESVTDGIFSIYQELLGLKFVDITKSNPQALYAEQTKLFCVFDSSDLLEEHPMGYFYLDLYPREGKYGHAAMFTFVRGSKYNKPISAIVCNFDAKSNVDYDNVVTYFHEFGHLMHNMVSTCEIASLSGTACQRDFVETPSQMFEEWCYCEEPLKRLVIPEFINDITPELVSKINKQNKQMQGIFNAGQISYGLLDQAIHSKSIPENTWEYFNELNVKLFGWEISPKTNMIANWGHMFGYDACYYGYQWSKVYSIELFSYFKSDPLNKEMGKKLRDKILSKGGSIDAMDLLRDFLGRDPDADSYINWLSE